MLKDLLEALKIFDEKDITFILSKFHFRVFEEGEFLLREGEISDKIFFIESGIIREFSENVFEDSLEDETEITHWILAENRLALNIESFVLAHPSKSKIQALTKLKCVFMYKEDYLNLVLKMPKLALAALRISEEYLLQLELRNKFHRIKSAEKRLEVFEKANPTISVRIKQKHLASYLNITQSQLSRIRNKRSSS